MKIDNKTRWDTRGLRAALCACEAWLGLKGNWCGRVYVSSARRRSSGHGGYAYFNGGSVSLFLKTPEKAADPADATRMSPHYWWDLCWVIEHEFLHVQGWRHSRMRRERHPAYQPWNDEAARAAQVLPVWARDLAPITVRAEKPAPSSAVRAAEADEHDLEALARWTRKLKLAKTKIKKLERRLAARHARLALAAKKES